MSRQALARLGSGTAGPVRLAVVLALVSTPIVGASFLLPPLFESDESFTPPALVHALVVAGIATVGAALVAGAIGGAVVRQHPTAGAVLALAIAWPVAVSLISVAARVLGVPFETAYSCFDTCGPMIHDSDAASGAGAYLVSLVVSAVSVIPIVIAVIFVVVAYRLNKAGNTLIATGLVAFGYGALHYLAFLAGSQPIVAYLCLGVGIALWTWALREPEVALAQAA